MVATLPPQKQEFVFFHGKSFYRFPVPFVFLHPFLIAEGTENFLMNSFCLKHLKNFPRHFLKTVITYKETRSSWHSLSLGDCQILTFL